MGVTQDDPQQTEPPAVLLADLDAHARHQAHELARGTVRLATLLVAGWKPHEARRELGMSLCRYEVAREWIKGALDNRR